MSDVIITADLPSKIESAIISQYDAKKVRLQDVGEEKFVQEAQNARALITKPGDTFGASLINQLPHTVGIVATYSTGVDHIDLAAAKKRGILVSNTPDVLTEATADIALLLILGAARGTSRAERMLRSKEWHGWTPEQTFGLDLKGKTLGIFGFGRIGQATANRARALGMRICYYARNKVISEDHKDALYCSTLDAFWAEADVISLHAPSTPQTRGVVCAESITKMKDGVIIINTARGDLIIDDDLINAVNHNKVFGVGLDVFTNEPDINPGYYDLDNAFLLPHIGSATVETRAAMGQKVLDNVSAYFSGHPLPDQV